ncbi:YybH family protein [Dinghuibacter silviterrae]|uniref:Ketosteroid isomerase-like protein n=1 Tax=Dinghuibacter silviterrae TaxID=1539049 RepID=A0A4R8DQP1_9BACT|nr:nuclear transport factor 2 family protein [Dinghuibacter silviterrae]TDW99626.1 ketosteroid isomerase-like protein [Dinghuibacter silviterrae]
MYKILLLLTLWAATTRAQGGPTAAAGPATPAPRQAPSDDGAIRQVLAQQVTAWNNADVTAFMQGYWQSDSLIFIGPKGPNYGWQPVLDHYKKVYPDKVAMGTLTFSNLVLKRLSGDYYFVIGAWHLTRTNGDLGGQFTLLFHKINGNWKIVVDHTS